MKRPPRRWLLWGALLLLVVLLLGVLVFLAAEYEESRDQEALERDAAALAGDIRSGLVRNVQTLQALHSVAPTAASWQDPAAELLEQHRELVRLEWRDAGLRLLAERDSSYVSDLYGQMARTQALPDVRQACESAQRVSGPSFSPSYFWPMSSGLGMELMEMCLPVVRAGAAEGYLVATYALPGLLSELTNKALLRNRGLAFTEVDGTRLALHSTVSGSRSLQVASALLDLPGHTLMLRLESPRRVVGLFPNVLTAVVGALSLALLAVLVLLGRDMRRRQRAETEVAEALAFRKAMENSLVTGLRARDMNGRVTYVNPAFCQMVGFSASELIGSGLPAPWWPPELVNEYQQRQAVRLAGQVLPREGYESVFQRKDGTRFPVLIIEAPLIDAQGTQTGFMSAILDLSEQRRVEELNRASQERLQATARLATVGEMASLLSHELNQPLAAIASYASGSLNLLDDADAPPDLLRQAMQRVSEQAERAGRVIKSVADFVRRREQVREAVAPADLLEAILPLLGLQAKKLGIRVETRIAPGCPAVLCDRTMVEQVLLNLARNGMQAMPEGDPPLASGLRSIQIHIAPRRAQSADGEPLRKTWVEFAVTDHGKGLSDEVREKLFTPFFTTKAEGMGLGLSLCRTVIEQHGGALTFEPAQPRGTVFRFTLPGV
ncbi:MULTISPECIES: two-component system sensor histidine kinase NtrB [Hydrogenophaga]|jgi:two-component system sensor histidine kinase DctS|uniref:histidine kinase n=1 Tax=Hydrogenophaga pseudoflava TaxID=47421 RepID=A0A4V1AC78_HYDPS|nr:MULTISPECIES: PAS domain S-box protein [Hydrogenophaga]OPF64949.1 PAS domain-containing sensor histidine kinase [Hydrogenophaga sp. H7]QBM30513.1 Sensor protein FixL [Hydrogenophaga pseudoflava]